MASEWIDEISATFSVLQSLSAHNLQVILEWNIHHAQVMQVQIAKQLSKLQVEESGTMYVSNPYLGKSQLSQLAPGAEWVTKPWHGVLVLQRYQPPKRQLHQTKWQAGIEATEIK